jgi:hypothetical protein
LNTAPDYSNGLEAPIGRSVSPILAAVRAHLSLSMVEVAAALEVDRPTIYTWLAGRSQPQERHRERLQRLFEVARRWSRLSNSRSGLAFAIGTTTEAASLTCFGLAASTKPKAGSSFSQRSVPPARWREECGASKRYWPITGSRSASGRAGKRSIA